MRAQAGHRRGDVEARKGFRGEVALCRAMLAALGICLIPWVASAQERPAFRVDLLADPLRSAPAALMHGAQLPGTDQSLGCDAPVDLSVELGLAGAVHAALCTNPRVSAAWIAIKTQAAGVGQARSAYLPKVNASVRRLRHTTWADDSNGQPRPSERQGNSSSVSLAWRLLDFGTRGHAAQAADDLLSAALTTHDAVVQQTMAAVVQAYFEVQAAQALLAGRQASLDTANGTLDAVQRRQAAGPGSASETLQARTAMARAMLERGRAEGALARAKVVLANVMGMRAESQMRLPALVAPDSPQLAEALTDWVKEAEANHPAVIAARLQGDAARAQANAARAEGLPSLDLVAAYYRNGRPEQGLSGAPTSERQVGFVLNIPLFEGFERTYRIRSAEALAEQREAERRDVEQRVAMEAAQAYAGAGAALQGLEASQLLMESATASHASSSRRYQGGVADVLEVLSTQQALADAQQQRSRSIAEWYGAGLRLVAAAGRLGMPDLSK